MQLPELITEYTQAYATLYQRRPSELRDLGEGWVLVNGARMTTGELEQLTQQLQREVEKAHAAKRSIVQKLLKWLSAPQAGTH